MAKVRTSASLNDPARAQLRGQLLTVFRDSRQLKENSAQLRQRLVGAVFGTAQQQLDQARAERFAESEASEARKQGRATAGATLGLGGLVGGVAGGISAGLPGATVGVAQGAGLGALAGLSGGLGQGAASPAQALFTESVTKGPQRAAAQTALQNFFAGGDTAVTTPTSASTVTANQPPPLLAAPAVAAEPAAQIQSSTNKIAQIANTDNDNLNLMGKLAMQAGDAETVALIAAEMGRRLGGDQ